MFDCGVLGIIEKPAKNQNQIKPNAIQLGEPPDFNLKKDVENLVTQHYDTE